MPTTPGATITRTRPHDVLPVDDQEPDERPVRLAVNVAPATAAALKRWAKARGGITITDAVRRLIRIGEFVDEVTEAGQKLAVIDAKGRVLREVQFL